MRECNRSATSKKSIRSSAKQKEVNLKKYKEKAQKYYFFDSGLINNT
jgi:hypothetical protein